MQAVREYAVNVLAKEMGHTAHTTPRYVVTIVYLIMIPVWYIVSYSPLVFSAMLF